MSNEDPGARSMSPASWPAELWLDILRGTMLPTFLVLYLLGVIPGLASPIKDIIASYVKLEGALGEHNDRMVEMRDTLRAQLAELARLKRVECRALVPRDRQVECDSPITWNYKTGP